MIYHENRAHVEDDFIYLRLESELGNAGSMLNDRADVVIGLVDKAAGDTKVVGDELGDLIAHVCSLEGLLPDSNFTSLEVGMADIRK